MRSEVTKLLNNMTKFFKIIGSDESRIQYTLQTPSRILQKNIYFSWLRSVLTKTQKHFPVYLSRDSAFTNQSNNFPYGYITQSPMCGENTVMVHNFAEDDTLKTALLKLNLVVPENDVMQYFIQWQRYRKYWWSSITTTPSLFSIDDIKYSEGAADVNIVANFPSGPHTVETIGISSTKTEPNHSSILTCTLSLDDALFILLLDGKTNCTREKYLRLHRTMAPFKMSYVLEGAPESTAQKELATLLYYRLGAKNISTRLPDFSAPMELQIKEILELGTPYTAILSVKTLNDGIFHLKNSSTRLNEMVHIADFESYATLICSK